MEVSDEVADAAARAWHEFAHGLEVPLTRRELGIMRLGWKAAVRAALNELAKEEA